MYQPHPDKENLFSSIPPDLVEATQNDQPIRFDDLSEMHELVWELATFITDWQPDLLPFFATGGIPYIFPVMRVLERQKQHALIDGHHFHLYQGLAWRADSEEIFATSFADVLRSQRCEDRIRVLVIDTTNSGNAVNNAVSACQLTLEKSGLSPDSIALRIIGIVNSSHSQAQTLSTNKALITGADRVAHVLTPSGIRCPSRFEDRQFAHVVPESNEAGFPFELAYWLAGSIPTEDRAELIGVQAMHETLDTKGISKSGRLKIVYGNNEVQQGTGMGHLPGRLISLLSLPLDAWRWDKMRAINELPPLDETEMEELAEVKELSDGGLRLFELMSTDQDKAVDGLLRISRPLMDVEVYWLGTVQPPPKRIASKVCATLERGCCTSVEALKYFRRTFPDLVASEPSKESLPQWWFNTVRSMPKEALTDEIKPGSSVDDSDDSGAEEGEPCQDFAESPDLALDFVVTAGGVEEARRLLTDENLKGMSLEELENELDATWPITADKALTFLGPTNEQVAMQYVLECGGWEQACTKLELKACELTVPPIFAGIDISSDTSKCAMAYGEVSPNDSLVPCIHVAINESSEENENDWSLPTVSSMLSKLVRRCKEEERVAIVGVDIPFGYPNKFASYLSAEPLKTKLETSKLAIVDDLLFRECEQQLKKDLLAPDSWTTSVRRQSLWKYYQILRRTFFSDNDPKRKTKRNKDGSVKASPCFPTSPLCTVGDKIARPIARWIRVICDLEARMIGPSLWCVSDCVYLFECYPLASLVSSGLWYPDLKSKSRGHVARAASLAVLQKQEVKIPVDNDNVEARQCADAWGAVEVTHSPKGDFRSSDHNFDALICTLTAWWCGRSLLEKHGVNVRYPKPPLAQTAKNCFFGQEGEPLDDKEGAIYYPETPAALLGELEPGV